MLPGCEIYMWDLIKRLPSDPWADTRSEIAPDVSLDSVVCQEACALACRVAAFVVVLVSRRFARLGL